MKTQEHTREQEAEIARLRLDQEIKNVKESFSSFQQQFEAALAIGDSQAAAYRITELAFNFHQLVQPSRLMAAAVPEAFALGRVKECEKAKQSCKPKGCTREAFACGFCDEHCPCKDC